MDVFKAYLPSETKLILNDLELITIKEYNNKIMLKERTYKNPNGLKISALIDKVKIKTV